MGGKKGKERARERERESRLGFIGPWLGTRSVLPIQIRIRYWLCHLFVVMCVRMRMFWLSTADPTVPYDEATLGELGHDILRIGSHQSIIATRFNSQRLQPGRWHLQMFVGWLDGLIYRRSSHGCDRFRFRRCSHDHHQRRHHHHQQHDACL